VLFPPWTLDIPFSSFFLQPKHAATSTPYSLSQLLTLSSTLYFFSLYRTFPTGATYGCYPCDPPDWQDFVGIVILLLVNSTIGYIEDKSAADAVAALKAALAPKAKVKRNGEWEVREGGTEAVGPRAPGNGMRSMHHAAAAAAATACPRFYPLIATYTSSQALFHSICLHVFIQF
jgi:hypothetical protein